LTLKDDTYDVIPNSVYDTPTLRILNVGNNKITHISPNVSRLTRLTSLWLGHAGGGNPIECLPNKLCVLTSLRTLYV
jgi:Leucine-rich repeat (LRR) protein